MTLAGLLDPVADRLHSAQRTASPVAPVTSADPSFDLDAGYQVQRLVVARRVAEGERRVGYKVGLTSIAKQRQLGLTGGCYGVLTDAMEVGGSLSLAGRIHPKVEPEIAFLLARDLAGAGLTAQDVLDATAAVAAAFEVVDSRFHDFRFALPDVVADNCSCSGWALSHRRLAPAAAGDPRTVAVRFRRNGVVVGEATGADVLGDPAAAVAWLAGELAARGDGLRAGDVVLSGGMTEAAAVVAGDVLDADFGRLGGMRLTVRP